MRLAKASQESDESGDNSYDVIEIDSSKPKVPAEENKAEEPPVVIRPEDFLISNSELV